jgi:hypothetical protein
MPAPNKPKTLIKKKMVATRTKIQMSKTGIRRKPRPETDTGATKPPPAVETAEQPQEVIPQAAPPQAIQEVPQKPKALVAKMVRPGKTSQPIPMTPVQTLEEPMEELSLLQDDNAPQVASVARITNSDKDPLVKTGIMKAAGPIQAKAFDKDQFVGIEIEQLKEQLQNYLEVCDSISGVVWEPKDIVDIIHVMARSLDFDTVSIFVLDHNNPDEFSPLVSRGYKTPPTAEIINDWKECLVPDANTINWGKLMRHAEKTDTPLARWIIHEGLNSMGYVPIHDGTRTYGFILVASYEKRESSPVASGLFEMCGGRLGLSINSNSCKRGGDWPQAVLETSREIRDQFTLIMGYVEMMREAGQLTYEEIIAFTDNCTRALTESIQLLDRMTQEASEA